MSYNISHIETPVLDAWMEAKDVLRLLSEHRYLPAQNFLHDLCPKALDACGNGEAQKRLPITRFTWSGDGSGHDYQYTLLPHLVPHIHGTIEAVLFWVGGDDVTGLLIRDGKAVECKVEVRVIKPEGWE